MLFKVIYIKVSGFFILSQLLFKTVVFTTSAYCNVGSNCSLSRVCQTFRFSGVPMTCTQHCAVRMHRLNQQQRVTNHENSR